MPLKVSDGIGAWIKDFKKSDAPQFKGKDEKERRDMALAAYLDAKRGDKNEDVSELAMKTDPKIPNLKTPRDKKYDRQKPLSTYKQAKKSGEIRKEDVRSADKKPEKYIGPDGKPKIRMVPVDKQIVKTEATGPDDKVRFHMTRADDHERHAKRHGQYDDVKNNYAKMDHEDAADAHKVAAGALKKHGATSHQFKKAFNHATNLTKNAKYSSAKAGKKLVMSYGKSVNEETNFEVNIEGLPMMFMSGMGPGEVKQKLRKIVKQPSMIQSVKRVTDADVKKNFRLKAQGRDEEEQIDEEIKYTHVALDSKGKIAGLASKESDSVDMARRHKGKALKLKKPISQKRGDMMVNRAPGLVMGDAYIVKDFNEAKLDELSPATMNSYKRKASDDLYRSTNKYTSPISKPRNKKQRDALDKHVDKRKAGLNLVRKRSGTAGYQDESK